MKYSSYTVTFFFSDETYIIIIMKNCPSDICVRVLSTEIQEQLYIQFVQSNQIRRPVINRRQIEETDKCGYFFFRLPPVSGGGASSFGTTQTSGTAPESLLGKREQKKLCILMRVKLDNKMLKVLYLEFI